MSDMTRRLTTGLILSLLVLLTSATGSSAQKRHDEPISDELYEKLVSRSEAIKKELAEETEMDVAGTYYDNDHHPTVISWAPKAGFVVTASLHTFAPSWVNFGKVTFQNDVLTIFPELSASEKSSYQLAERYRLIIWDDWRFLIPENELQSFAYAVHSGSGSNIEAFFAKPGDRKRDRKGLPNLPGEFLPIMKMSRIHARITEVNEVPNSPFPTVILNVGRRQKVAEGMSFYYAKKGDCLNVQFVVGTVSEISSTANVTMMGGTCEGDTSPKAGWALTSKMPKGFIEPG